MESLLSIGTKIDKESVAVVGELILNIINTNAGDAVKCCAIDAISSGLNVKGVQVNHCNFANAEKPAEVNQT